MLLILFLSYSATSQSRHSKIFKINQTAHRLEVPPDFRGTHVSEIMAINDLIYKRVVYTAELSMSRHTDFHFCYWVIVANSKF